MLLFLATNFRVVYYAVMDDGEKVTFTLILHERKKFMFIEICGSNDGISKSIAKLNNSSLILFH